MLSVKSLPRAVSISIVMALGLSLATVTAQVAVPRAGISEIGSSGNVPPFSVGQPAVPERGDSDDSVPRSSQVPSSRSWSVQSTPATESVPTSEDPYATRSTAKARNYYYGNTVPRVPEPQRQSQVMVIPTQEVRPAELSALSEDMVVMLHILKQKTSQEQRGPLGAVFSDFGDFFPGQRPAFEALYVQGQGILFFLNANFDVLPEPQPAQQPAAPADSGHVDPVWQSARRETLTSQGPVPRPASHTTRQSADELAADLMTVLKHAANIRFLGKEETITVRVLRKDPFPTNGVQQGYGMGMPTGMNGFTAGGGFGGSYGLGGGGGFGGGGVAFPEGGYGMDPAGTPDTQRGEDEGASPDNHRTSGTGRTFVPGARVMRDSAADTLTLHVLKSNVDAFAQERISLEEFKRRVKVLKYQSAQR